VLIRSIRLSVSTIVARFAKSNGAVSSKNIAFYLPLYLLGCCAATLHAQQAGMKRLLSPESGCRGFEHFGEPARSGRGSGDVHRPRTEQCWFDFEAASIGRVSLYSLL